MDAILSDCGIALYGAEWWLSLGAEWSAILADARRIGYPFRHIMKLMRETESKTEMDLLIRVVRGQHKRVYKWFESEHDQSSYMRILPADIRSIIEWYLRSQMTLHGSSITAVMGLFHSFNDLPAVSGSIRSNWYYLGKLHRHVGPAIISHRSGYTIIFAWYYYGHPACTIGNAAGTFEGANGMCYLIMGSLGEAEPTRNPETIAIIRAICLRDLGIDLPK